MAIENARGARELLGRAIAAPEDAAEDLPQLLSAVDHDDPAVRIGAAWGLCAVASHRPDAADRIRNQLRHRSSTAAELAADWIERESLPSDGRERATVGRPTRSAVADEMDGSGADETDDANAGDRTVPARPAPSDASDDDQAATSAESGAQPASGGGQPRAGTDDAAREGAATEDVARDDAAHSDGARVDAARDDAGRDGAAHGGADATDVERSQSTAERSRPAATDEVVRNEHFTIELERTALDRLEIVDRVATDRHSWTYAAIATIEARETAVLVRTYRPPEGARLSTFAAAFEEVVEEWAGVDDHDAVLPVHDYGRRPHPWIVVGYAPTTLRTTGRLPALAAMQVGYDAASALAHAHERGVTHRSLDPRSLALDTDDGRPRGRLLNLGIVDAFRVVEGPLPMDSRFAAPELFDDEYGDVDRLTDVYQLGATLYTAATGRPPFRESLVERGGPADVPVEPPSAVVDGLPAAVDRVVETAMATHKVARYESASELALALRRAASELGGSV